MLEHEQGFDRSSQEIDELVNTQYDTALNVLWRWELYKYAENPTQLDESAVEFARLSGYLNAGSTVLDVGCSDGSFLEKIRSRIESPLNLIGVDPISDQFIASRDLDLRRGRAENLDLVEPHIHDQSIDFLSSFYMLYHVKEPELALEEFKRVLKTGGLLAITTSGANNKIRHRQFERHIAEYLSIEPPRVFSQHFDNIKAEEVVPKYFKIIRSERLDTFLVIRQQNQSQNEGSYQAYYNSLVSMLSAFNPQPSIGAFREAFNIMVKPRIDQQIEDHGAFYDTVERHLFLCVKE